MADTYCYGRSESQLRHRHQGGKLFLCGKCGGDSFIVHHIHNPYGHDACERNAQCVACGTTWAGGYYTWDIVQRQGADSPCGQTSEEADQISATQPNKVGDSPCEPDPTSIAQSAPATKPHAEGIDK